MTLPVAAPETRGADAAREVAAEHLPDWLRLHSERSYQFAAAHARDRRIDHDAELLFVAAMVHDLSLVSGFDDATLPFEGGAGARERARLAASPAGASRAGHRAAHG
jgi:hypothetical protein